MTVKTRANIKSDADTYIGDNTSQDISPLDIRDRIKDLADSAFLSGDGGSTAKLVAVFAAQHNQPPTSNYATLDTRNSHPVLDFDTTTQETAVFAGALPSNYPGNGLTVKIISALTSATSGTLGWDVAFERDNTGLDIDADSFATAKTAAAATVPGTSGQTMAHTVTFSNSEIDGLLAGEPFRLRIRRDVANDNATGDAELLRVVVEQV